ncbi:UNVERIFIED_CONTAM: putative aminopeptidase FrvX [Brevibacillus sp. OAP136]
MSEWDVLLRELDEIPGVSGDEERVAAYMRQKLLPLSNGHWEDALGNQIFVKHGSRPDVKLMLSAHMDEIGFIVRHIDENGFVYFHPVGYHDSRMLMNQVLTIHTEAGPRQAITGTMPAHLLTPEMARRSIPLADIYLDLGTSSRAETMALGVQIGDMITFERKGTLLNGSKLFTGKAVDNRSSCAVLIETMKRLSGKQVQPTIYAVASVQEEVGLRGAGTAAFAIKPTVAIAIDVTFAGDSPALPATLPPMKLGGGPVIKYYDWTPDTGQGNNVPKSLTRQLVRTAESLGIPYQHQTVLNGGTDAATISLAGAGAVTGIISLPSRYIHSATGCVHLDDLAYTVDLLTAFIEQME